MVQDGTHYERISGWTKGSKQHHNRLRVRIAVATYGVFLRTSAFTVNVQSSLDHPALLGHGLRLPTFSQLGLDPDVGLLEADFQGRLRLPAENLAKK